MDTARGGMFALVVNLGKIEPGYIQKYPDHTNDDLALIRPQEVY